MKKIIHSFKRYLKEGRGSLTDLELIENIYGMPLLDIVKMYESGQQEGDFKLPLKTFMKDEFVGCWFLIGIRTVCLTPDGDFVNSRYEDVEIDIESNPIAMPLSKGHLFPEDEQVSADFGGIYPPTISGRTVGTIRKSVYLKFFQSDINNFMANSAPWASALVQSESGKKRVRVSNEGVEQDGQLEISNKGVDILESVAEYFYSKEY